jgi:hypothetical protein
MAWRFVLHTRMQHCKLCIVVISNYVVWYTHIARPVTERTTV